MMPTLKPGSIVVARRRPPRAGEIAVARWEKKEVIKRVRTITNDAYYLVGDNPEESFDSRHYGPFEKKAVIGTVVFVLALPSPSRRKPRTAL